MTLAPYNANLRWRLCSFHQSKNGILLAVSVLLIAFILPSCGLMRLGMIKLRFGCLPEGTRIDTADGSVRIEDLKAGDFVTGFKGSPVQISQIHQYLEDAATSRYLTIHFDNGSVVSASARHRINGVPASSLKVGDACGSHVVTRIEPRYGVARSFDLLTEDAGYRIGGIPVNSMIEEMLGR
jgi:Hint domain